MAKLKAVIVDDEELARRGLALRLQQYPDVEIIAQCAGGREALDVVNQQSPDLVFLDVQMPGMDGFDFVRRIQPDAMPLIIFVTAYDQYAIDAFRVHAVDYILKPPEEKSLTGALENARRQLVQKHAVSDKGRLLSVISDITGKGTAEMEDWLARGGELKQSFPDRITIRDNGRVTFVEIDEIDWIDAAGDYMCLHTNGQVHVMRSTMKQLECQLDPDRFQRIHRSTIINLSRVREISPHNNGEYYLVLEGGARLKMSRNYRDKVDLISQV